MLNEMDIKGLEEGIERQFPGMTIEQVLKLAEFGKAVLEITDGDLAQDLIYVTEKILKADPDLVHDTQYCLSSVVALARCILEYERNE